MQPAVLQAAALVVRAAHPRLAPSPLTPADLAAPAGEGHIPGPRASLAMTTTAPKPATTGHLPLKMWTHGVAVEEAALEQLRVLAGLPVADGVAAMPDLRPGPAAPPGCVLATRSAIVPAALGVDLGCGVAAVMTSLTSWDLPDDTGPVRAAVAAAIPHGRT